MNTGDDWDTSDVEPHQTLADLFSNPLALPSTGTTGVRNRHARLSRSILSDYIAATTTPSGSGSANPATNDPNPDSNSSSSSRPWGVFRIRDATREPVAAAEAASNTTGMSNEPSSSSSSTPPGVLSLDQLLGPPPRSTTTPAPARTPHRTTVAEYLRRTSAYRTGAGTGTGTGTSGASGSGTGTGTASGSASQALGMSWPNYGIQRARDRDGDQERDRTRTSSWTPAIDSARRAGYGGTDGGTNGGTNGGGNDAGSSARAATASPSTQTTTSSGTPSTNAATPAPAAATPAPAATPASTSTAAAPTATAEAEGPASRARRTILQDSAPRPRSVPGPQQVVPSGSHYSWASYLPMRNRSSSATAGASSSSNNNTAAAETNTAANNNAAAETSADANNNTTASATPAAPSGTGTNHGTTNPPSTTTANSNIGRRPASTFSAAELFFPAPTTVNAIRNRNERMATTVLRRRRGDGGTTTTRITYGFDPTDIAPPGGGDDHIWDMLGDPLGDDSDDGLWGVYTNGLRVGDAGSMNDTLGYIGGFSTPPDAVTPAGATATGSTGGAALSRGGFNRRRQSFRSHRLDLDDEDDIIIEFPPRPVGSWPPTNLDTLTRAPAPVVVGERGMADRAIDRERIERDREERGSRPRPDDDDMDDSDNCKRQKRGVETGPTRPSYLSLTSLPPSTPIPNEFNTPDGRSHLELTVGDDGRQIITFSDRHADRITEQMDDACALRTVHPIPLGVGVFYYEAQVLSTGREANITLGFMLPHTDLRRLVGWDKGTYGWHGDDGKVFEQTGDGRDFSQPWKKGEILGLGLDTTLGRVFLTRNGVLLGHVFNKLPANLHVAVGLQSLGESVALNFAGPFKYDIDAHVARIRDRVLAQLAPPRFVFSGGADEGSVPRIAGSEPKLTAAKSVGVGVDKPSAALKKPATKPADHTLDAPSRAAAALVLDHLQTAGHARVAAMMRSEMARRGWIAPPDTNVVPSMPDDPDVPVQQYPSPGAAIASLINLLSAPGTPRMPTRLLGSLDLSALDAGVARRLRVYDFAGLAMEAAAAMDADGEMEAVDVEVDVDAGDERMDVDDVEGADGDVDIKDANENEVDVDDDVTVRGPDEDSTSTSPPLPSASGSGSGSASPSPSVGDIRAQFLATMRQLAADAKAERWAAADAELLSTATGVVVGAHAGAERACARLREARMRDVPEIARFVRELLGVKQHSYLRTAIAQTGLVHTALVQRGDADAAFVNVRDVLGLGAE